MLQIIVSNTEQLQQSFQTRNTLFHSIHCYDKCIKMQGRRHIHTFQLVSVDERNIMAVDIVYENQDTTSPRLNKQYTTVVDLGTVTVWYDRWKERLSEHADHIKTLGQFIRTPPQKKHKTTTTSFQTKPVCQSLSVKNCCLTLHSVSGKLFFCLQSRNPNKICLVVRDLKNMLPFCVCEALDPYMIFCLAHFQNLPQ